MSGPAADTAAGRLELALAGLVPSEVRVGALGIDPRWIVELLPEELDAVRSAVATRRAEFATGRALLHRLTGSADAIGVLADRSPRWPEGLVGSLSHDDRTAVAAVTAAAPGRAIGVDLEVRGALHGDEAAFVLRPDDAEVDPCAAMCMKEAVYKAWSALGGPVLEFSDVRVRVDGERFEAEVLGTSRVFDGRWTAVEDRWLAVSIS